MTAADATEVGRISERAAFARGVCECPQDDTRRLVFADWLTEHGEEGYAELIRVQCELASRYPGWAGEPAPDSLLTARHGGHYARLRDREWELWESAGLRDALAAGLPYGFALTLSATVSRDRTAVVRRGFVSEVRCDLATFLVHAADLFAAHPVERVVLTDRETYTDSRSHYWSTTGWGQVSDALPDDLFSRLPDLGMSSDGRSMRGFATRDAALDALSAACVAHGRHLAGLTPAPPPGR